MSILKRLFCGHNLEFVRNIYGDEIIERGWKRSLWRCSKCGAMVAKDALHSA
jgi:ribosomal protein L37AE/L43A